MGDDSEAGADDEAVRGTIPFPRLVSTAGAILILLSTGQTLLSLRTGEEILVAGLDMLLVGFPGLILLFTGFWMPTSSIERRYYPRLLAWVLGGVGVMFSFIALRDLHPGVTVEWSIGTQAIALTLGSIGGLLIGIQETQALMRQEQLEARTQELSEREHELEAQNDRLEEFANIVSHDLRNPLAVAKGNLEFAREEDDNEHLSTVASAHERMDVLIDDVLTLARQGGAVESTEPIVLRELVENCWANVSTGGSTLVVETDRTVEADATRLKQLVENLLRNAVEHGGEEVTVTVGDVDGGLYLADDGPGIDDDQKADVFDSGYSTAEDGTGFGLSIVRRIARAHGWDVTVVDGEAGGARFEFTNVEIVEPS